MWINLTVSIYRKNHQHAIESLESSLEAEQRGKADAVRAKKKLEGEINELEAALDSANRGRMEAEKNVKKHQQAINELRQQIEDEHRAREEADKQVKFHLSTLLYKLFNYLYINDLHQIKSEAFQFIEIV